jgi:hypothetical protein
MGTHIVDLVGNFQDVTLNLFDHRAQQENCFILNQDYLQKQMKQKC